MDPIFFESAYYLAPDEGGEKAYRLLADVMEQTGRVALAEMVSYHKENLVLIRPARRGLILQTMYYANEIRDFGAIRKAQSERLTPAELELATALVEKLSSEEFEPQAYSDLYQTQLLAMLEEKKQGREITVARRAPARGEVVDMYAVLKRSLETARPRQKARPGRKKKA